MMSFLQRSGSHFLTWALAVCWMSSLLTGVFGEYHFAPYIPQSFFFDWTPQGQSPPVPTSVQCQVNHISWGRQTATGPNPTAPYSLQVFTSTFVVPLSIDAGSGLEFDFPVPFIPDTQYQICMWDSVGNSGGCQAIYTVYQAPNTTLADPPICRNLTYPQETQNLGIETASAAGNLSQFGWIDQCTDISVKPTNGTPPYTMTIAPSLHPPINITSNSMDSINWTNTLSWGMPFFVSLADSSGMSWAYGPLHSGGGGSTDCLIGRPLQSDGKIQPWVAGVTSVITLITGLLVGLLGAVYLSRRVRKQSLLRPDQFLDRKSTSTTGSLHSVHDHYGEAPSLPPAPVPPGVPLSFARDATHNRVLGSSASRQFKPFALPPDPEAGGRMMASSSVLDITSPTLSRSTHDLSRSPSAATSELLSRSPSGTTSQLLSRSPSDASTATSGDVRSATSHVYVVHHDGGRAPVTVYTEDGTEVVELPPRYASPPPRPQPPPVESPPTPAPASQSTSTPTAQTQDTPRPDLPKPPLSPNQLTVVNP